jgi:hypothetical protein
MTSQTMETLHSHRFGALDELLSGIESQAIKLDDLNLSYCDLPTSSLVHLARIVVASAETLSNLNLMGNHLNLCSREDFRAWETFLMAFRHCIKMRHLALSGNRLGDKGIETFLRVYLREMEDSEWDEEQAGGVVVDSPFCRPFSTLSVHDEDDDAEPESVMESPVDYPSSSTSALAASPLIKDRRLSSGEVKSIPSRGLRSIAYIDFSSVGMTDVSALHLTYFLPYHLLPHVLLRRLDPHIPETDGDELYDPTSFCRGITYGSSKLDDSDFSPLAKKILDLVEKVRRAGGMAPQRTIPSYLASGFGVLSGGLPPSPDVRGRTADSPRGHAQEIPSPSRRDSNGGSTRTTSAITAGRSVSVPSTGSTPLHLMAHWTEIMRSRPKFQGEILKAAGTVHISQLWATAVKLLSLARIFTLFPTQPRKQTNLPTQSVWPKQQRKMEVRVTLPPTTPTSPVRPSLPRMSRGDCVGGLDRRLWLRILLEIADPEGCLSERQGLHVLSWAADSATLAKESEWAGKLPHVQIWKLLDVLLPYST